MKFTWDVQFALRLPFTGIRVIYLGGAQKPVRRLTARHHFLPVLEERRSMKDSGIVERAGRDPGFGIRIIQFRDTGLWEGPAAGHQYLPVCQPRRRVKFSELFHWLDQCEGAIGAGRRGMKESRTKRGCKKTSVNPSLHFHLVCRNYCVDFILIDDRLNLSQQRGPKFPTIKSNVWD